jgi:CRP-like cAMP-binding protein
MKSEINYRKGETIIKQNGFASHIYFIKKGLIKIYLENKKKNLIIEIAGEGTMLGLSSLNYNKNYNFSVSAISDVEACEIDIESLNSIVNNNIGFSSNIITQLNHMLDKLMTKVNCLSQKDLRSRTAELIIDLADNIYKSRKFEIELSRNELAEITNMAVENIVRVLKEFDKLNYIKLKGKNIEIINYEKLHNIASKYK